MSGVVLAILAVIIFFLNLQIYILRQEKNKQTIESLSTYFFPEKNQFHAC